MKKSFYFAFITLIFCFATACSSTNETESSCDEAPIVDTEQYNNATTDAFEIQDISINGDCLTVQISSGGCDGNNWEVKLFASEEVLESLPPQRNLKISLKDEEDCEALIMKEFKFNISSLQVNGSENVILNFSNFDEALLYEY